LPEEIAMFNPVLVSPAPVRYEASLETPEDDEAKTTRSVVETLRGISDKTLADGGQPLRSVHAKGHGLSHRHASVDHSGRPAGR
jgi:hypothetical protein